MESAQDRQITKTFSKEVAKVYKYNRTIIINIKIVSHGGEDGGRRRVTE